MAVRPEAEVDKVEHRWRTGDVLERFAVAFGYAFPQIESEEVTA